MGSRFRLLVATVETSAGHPPREHIHTHKQQQTMNTSIATSFKDLTSFELMAWLDEGKPTEREAKAIERELAVRADRRRAVEDLLW